MDEAHHAKGRKVHSGELPLYMVPRGNPKEEEEAGRPDYGGAGAAAGCRPEEGRDCSDGLTHLVNILTLNSSAEWSGWWYPWHPHQGTKLRWCTPVTPALGRWSQQNPDF